MKIKFEKNKTSTLVVMYSLYLYFLGLSLRNISNALIIFQNEKRSHVSVWNWIQRFCSAQIYNKHRRISAFIIDETMIQIGSENCWLWVVLNQYENLYLEFTYQRKETCLLLNNLLDH